MQVGHSLFDNFYERDRPELCGNNYKSHLITLDHPSVCASMKPQTTQQYYNVTVTNNHIFIGKDMSSVTNPNPSA